MAYAREGANVVCADLSPTAKNQLPGEELQATDALIQQSGGIAAFVKCDIAEPEDVKHAVEVTVRRFGRLDM
jgi:NAD(P)-dependent dehydrogenase (short-subunit alcohol dehydrogenase family)